jgi:predicted transposase/invertase (TIGR01784 family)
LSIFDNVCKFLAASFSQDFAQWLLREAIGLTQLSPSELSVEPIRADALILLASEQVVLHLEFQTQPDMEIPCRMADYRLRIYRRYPNKQMRQVVIDLKRTGSELVQQRALVIPGTRHEFEVVRLCEVPEVELLRCPGLWPLVVLSRTGDRTQTLRTIAQQIEALPSRRERSNVAAATAILAGLVLEKAVIRKLLREELMQESVIYQDIVAEAMAKGKVEGKAKGEVALVWRLLDRRLGSVPAELVAQVEGLPLEQLEALAEALLDFALQADLRNWLARNKPEQG